MSNTTFPVQTIAKSHLHAVDFSNLGFGNFMSDHMFRAVYSRQEWHSPEILPYGPIEIMPTALALHYGQSVFEGMKAFRMKSGSISVFRIQKHYERLIRSLERMCMPTMSYHLFEQGILQLIEKDQEFVPQGMDDSLYLRPLVFASEAKFGVKISDEYQFIIMTGPVGPFYSNPLKVKVENKYSRAAHGGTGAAKCAGNYGGAFYATRIAREEGYDQVLWTDCSNELNIEESGTMNVFFHIGDALITPALSDTILDGVTRDSLITLATSMGIHVEQRTISAAEIAKAAENGSLKEAFGAGTAAITARIGMIGISGKHYQLPTVTNSISQQLHDALLAIRVGEKEDVFGWNTIVKVSAPVKG
jgi:branched-chain amino acid aminotransferase